MKHLFIVISLFVSVSALAQDIHFSQFNVAPMVYNPAFTGMFEGDVRFIGNQRTQWRSVTVPYNTVGGSVDARGILSQDELAGGFSIYQDRAGDSRLNTLAINVAGSFEVAQSFDSLHRFYVGAQVGLTHRKIDYSALTYDNQWNGFAYQSSLDPNEDFARDARTHGNLNIGGAWQYRKDKRHDIQAGIAFHHLNGPKQSFFDDPSIRLDLRFSVNGSGVWKVNEEWDAMGGILFQRQGTFMEIIPGAGARYVLEDGRGMFRTIFGGVYWRTRDAGYILAGMDYDQWRVGLSYDINTSDLRPASNARGGLEISVVYILERIVPPTINRRLCPEYL
ncbi:PorP/SprF family type IX secretion system membrane protein [Sanyastnella coralliicola]|uniref:PorP/SprF family type IX secretion system membrane protein n=1 Tax=Sanyastnella coralliicola TaxID=3069118 RepID=UPI0027BB1197|nr:PorP/SprF family type IX secretion system membrane protein [Longitalea sp. SCSIO 12813]